MAGKISYEFNKVDRAHDQVASPFTPKSVNFALQHLIGLQLEIHF